MPSPSKENSTLVRARPLLGTLVEIRASIRRRDIAKDSAQLNAAIDAAFAEIEHIHDLMSYHNPDSELTRLNQISPLTSLQVSLHTYNVLKASLQIAHASQGAFDPCIGAPLERWGYLPALPSPPNTAAANASPQPDDAPHGSWQAIELLPNQRVRLQRPLHIDLGGIAKGYAVDVAVQTLQQAGIDNLVVNAGGDLRVCGPSPHEVVIRNPQEPHQPGLTLHLSNGALASSGAYYSRKIIQSHPVSALCDPRSHQPYVGHEGVTIRASTCMVADALTKVVLFAPTEIAEDVLQAFAADAYVLQKTAAHTASQVS